MKAVPWKVLLGLSGLVYLAVFCISTKARMFYVATGSMEPLIPSGSLIFSKAATATELNLGQVVVVIDRTTGRLVVHRLISRTAGAYVMRGDTNSIPDKATIAPADVLGVVVAIIPVGNLLAFSAQLLFLALTFVLGVLLSRFLLFLQYGVSR